MLQQRTPRSKNKQGFNVENISDMDEQAEMIWAKKEEENAEQRRQAELRAQLQGELHPSRTCLHRFFVLVSFVVGVTAFLMGLGQFVGIAYLHVGPIQYVMRIYVIILCVLAVFNELEWSLLTRDSALLKYWISRGVYYGFIGVLGLEENNVTPAIENSSAIGKTAALNFIKVVAWMMVGCGIIYFVMGLLCLQLIDNRLRQDYTQRVDRAKEARRMQQTYGNFGVGQTAV